MMSLLTLLRHDPYVYFAAMAWGISFLAVAKSITTHVDREIDSIDSRQHQIFSDQRPGTRDGEAKPKESEAESKELRR
jgi:hypothetical protein